MARTVLVLGANGRFGHTVAKAFAAVGWTVLAQARRPLKVTDSTLRPVRAGLDDLDALLREAKGAEVVVYAVNPPYDRWATDALPLARQGMDVAQRLNAVFMLPGNVYNFGEGMPSRLHVDTPQQPSTRKGRIRCDMESELEQRAARGLRSVVLRAGDFYGAGSGSWFDMAITKSLRQGKLVYPGPLDVPHAWAYLPELARAFVALADCAVQGKLPAFSRFHFAGHTLTGQQLLDAIEQAANSLGLRPAGGFKRGGFPWPVLRLGGLVWPKWRELVEMAYLWRVPHALDDAALQGRVGPLPSTPLDAALRSSLLSMGFSQTASAPNAELLRNESVRAEVSKPARPFDTSG